MQIQKINSNTTFGAIKIPSPDQIMTEHAGSLQSMIDIDWDEKEVVFSPFMDYEMFSFNLKDNFLYRLTKKAPLLPFEKETNEFIAQNIDILG